MRARRTVLLARADPLAARCLSAALRRTHRRRRDARAARGHGVPAHRALCLSRAVPAHLSDLAQAPIEQAEALEQLRAMWHGERIAVRITHEAPPPGVDTPADLARVRALFLSKS